MDLTNVQHVCTEKRSWPVGTTFTVDAQGFHVPSAVPVNVFVDIEGGDPSLPPYPDLPADWPSTVVPIAPIKATFQHSKPTHLAAFATTCHGIQGYTTDRICVNNPRPPSYRAPDRHSLYVSLSRVRTRAGLLMGVLLDKKELEYFRPSPAVLEEDKRLRELALRTTSRMQRYMADFFRI